MPLGVGVRVLVVVLVVLVSVFCIASTEGNEAADVNVLSPAATSNVRLPFTLVRDFLIVVHVSVGRFHDLNFIVDTGSNRTIIDQHLAKQLGLRLTTAQLLAVNASTTVAETTVPEIQLSARRVTSVSVLVRDLAPFGKLFKTRIDGIVGGDLLDRGQLSIDYQTRTLMLGECNSAPFHARFAMPNRLPVMQVEVEGRPVRLMIDTAASPMQLFATRNGDAHAAGEATGIAGRMRASESLLREVRLGDNTFLNVQAFTVNNRPEGLSEFDGLLSPAALGMKSICLDFARREFSWVP